MKKLLKQTFFSLARSSFLQEAFKSYRGRGTILMYHRLRESKDKPGDFDPNGCLCVTPETFEAQLNHLKAHHKILTLDDFIAQLKSGTLPINAVTITFDDGYRDNLTLALPILKKLQVPATIYFTMNMNTSQMCFWWHNLEHVLRSLKKIQFSFKNTSHEFDLATSELKMAAFNAIRQIFIALNEDDQKDLDKILLSKTIEKPSPVETLSEDDIRQMSASGLITFGAHSVTHAVLKNLPDGIEAAEMQVSKKYLEVVLEKPTKHFAYPFGSALEAGPREFESAKKVGFESATTTRFGHIHDEHAAHLHALPRLPVNEMSLLDFKARLSGIEAAARNGLKRVLVD